MIRGHVVCLIICGDETTFASPQMADFQRAAKALPQTCDQRIDQSHLADLTRCMEDINAIFSRGRACYGGPPQ